MSTKIALDSFLAIAKRSNLLTAEQLKSHREAFAERGGDAGDARKFAEFLVKQQAVTRWQADKLLQGKHKGFFLGKYRLLSLLGKGGMSSVYLAEHVLMRRRCAIKVLPTKRVHDTSYLGRFHREAQAVAALDDPNIVRAYDVDHEVDGDMEIHFLVMEYVDGKSLLALVQDDGPVSPVVAADFIRQAALGLAHAHQAGLVHRDIKPGNLLVDRAGTVKLLDLGLARFFAGSEDVALTIEHDEKVLGTADYLAPEQAVDSHLVDARADIYSLGCTLYFLLTGHPPFTEGTLTQRLLAHQTKQPPGVDQERSDVPGTLLVILKRMMAKHPDDRYQDCEEVAAEMAAWLRANGGADRVPGSDAVSAPRGAQSTAETTVGAELDTGTRETPSEPSVDAGTSDSALGPTPEPELGAFLAGLERSTNPVAKPVEAARPPAESPRRRPPAKSKPDSSQIPRGRQQPTRRETVVEKPDGSADSQATVPAKFGDGMRPVIDPEHVAPVIFTAPPELTPPLEMTFNPAEPVAPMGADSSTRLRRRRKGRNNSTLIGVAIAVGVALVVGIGLAVSQNGSGDDPSPPPEEFHGASGGPIADSPKYPDNLGPEIRVGADQVFPTISDAIEYASEHAERFGPDNPWVILVTGGAEFDERLTIRGSRFGSEGIPDGTRIASDGAQVVLRPRSGEGPVIDLGDTADVTISGFVVDAGGEDVAIRLADDLLNTRLEYLTVTGFADVGIECAGWGLQGRPVRISSVTVRNEAQGTVGMRFNDVREAEIVDCRFVGPMKAGLEFVTSARSGYVAVRQCRFHELQEGVIFSGGESDLQDFAFINNTFHRVQRGVVLRDMPAAGSSGFEFKHNLFSEITGAEVVVERRYDAERAAELVSPDAAVNNWSTRSADEAGDGELDIFPTGGRRGIDVPFESTDPNAENFLKPADRTVRTDVGTPAQGAAGYVGSVPP